MNAHTSLRSNAVQSYVVPYMTRYVQSEPWLHIIKSVPSIAGNFALIVRGRVVSNQLNLIVGLNITLILHFDNSTK